MNRLYQFGDIGESTLHGYAPLAYNQGTFRFIELTPFSRARDEYFDDDEFAAFQRHLASNPLAGDVIPDTGGVRKLRWGRAGSGKRGGIRVIYFWDEPRQTFYMLYVYRKNAQEDLTAQQLRTLARLVREEFG